MSTAANGTRSPTLTNACPSVATLLHQKHGAPASANTCNHTPRYSSLSSANGGAVPYHSSFLSDPGLGCPPIPTPTSSHGHAEVSSPNMVPSRPFLSDLLATINDTITFVDRMRNEHESVNNDLPECRARISKAQETAQAREKETVAFPMRRLPITMNKWVQLNDIIPSLEPLIDYATIAKDIRSVEKRSSGIGIDMHALQIRLTDMKTRVTSELEAHAIAARCRTCQVERQTDADLPSATYFQPHAVDDPMEQLPPQLYQLYDRMGDFKIHKEEILNFEYDFQKEFARRHSPKARASHPLQTDQEFFEDQQKQLEELKKDLKEALRDVSRLRKLCRAEGLPFDDTESIPDYPDDAASAFEDAYLESLGGMPSAIKEHHTKQARLHEWVSQLNEPRPLLKRSTSDPAFGGVDDVHAPPPD